MNSIDLQKLERLKISWLRRISFVRMNILSKTTFLFQLLLIYAEEKNLKKCQEMMNGFVWNGKKLEIRFKVLQDERKRRLSCTKNQIVPPKSCISFDFRLDNESKQKEY